MHGSFPGVGGRSDTDDGTPTGGLTIAAARSSGSDERWATMTPFELFGAGLALAAVVAVGTIVHELSHAFVLHAIGVSYDVEWLPGADDAGLVRASITGGWATVRLRGVPDDLAPWKLRLAALVPLVLATPFLLTLIGVLPDLSRAGNPAVSAAAIGWLACALPSPQDFSLFWHADRASQSSPNTTD